MFLRQLDYLTALARERHFGRAALACQVSQPALSTAISKLERELGVPLVHRGHRYDDLTPEGQSLLRWVHQVQAGITGLETEAARLREQATGTLRLGVIPTALGVTPLIVSPMLRRYPGIRFEIRSLSSRQIGQRLGAFELDAGITYLDNEPLGELDSAPVYTERYLLLAPSESVGGDTVAWAELADLPLCLLTSDMQNRRIVDSVFRQVGLDVTTCVEADSISALMSFARAGWPCVIADAWLATQGHPPGMSSVKLTDPTVTQRVGLVTRHAELQPPLVRLLKDVLRGIDVDSALTGSTAAVASRSI